MTLLPISAAITPRKRRPFSEVPKGLPKAPCSSSIGVTDLLSCDFKLLYDNDLHGSGADSRSPLASSPFGFSSAARLNRTFTVSYDFISSPCWRCRMPLPANPPATPASLNDNARNRSREALPRKGQDRKGGRDTGGHVLAGGHGGSRGRPAIRIDGRAGLRHGRDVLCADDPAGAASNPTHPLSLNAGRPLGHAVGVLCAAGGRRPEQRACRHLRYAPRSMALIHQSGGGTWLLRLSAFARQKASG